MNSSELNKELGNIDIYLLDQILKDRIKPEMKVLDAGCGEGRNLSYFMNNGYDVHGIDLSPLAIRMLHFIASSNGYENYKERFQVGDLQKIEHPDASFDWVVCIAVLHFTDNETSFFKIIEELLRILKPNGGLFLRMSTAHLALDLDKGSFTYQLSESALSTLLTKYGLELIEPIKTIVVENTRTMCTLVFKKV